MTNAPIGRGQRTVSRRNVSRQVADIMRDMILVGELKPGQVVTHEEISSRLGVSTMPVREALLRLSHEGFIDARESRSFRVVPTSRDDIADIYWMHGVLAGELAARACRNDAENVADQLDGINAVWERTPAGAALESFEELNWHFHRVINLAAKAPKILVLLRHTIRFIPDHFYKLVPAWRDVSRVGHQQIATVMRMADPDKVREVAEAHVRDAGELLIGYFSETGFWQEPTPPKRRASK